PLDPSPPPTPPLSLHAALPISAMTGKNRNIKRTIARLLDRFDIFITYRHRQAAALGNFSGGVRGANRLGIPQGVLHEFTEPCLRSEEHTSELQSREKLVCRLLL